MSKILPAGTKCFNLLKKLHERNIRFSRDALTRVEQAVISMQLFLTAHHENVHRQKNTLIIKAYPEMQAKSIRKLRDIYI